MGLKEEAEQGLPYTNVQAGLQQNRRWVRWLLITKLCLISFVLYHTDFSWQFTGRKPLRNHLSALGNGACPQVSPFQLPGTHNDTEGPSVSDLAKLLSGAVQVDTTVGDNWPTVKDDPARWHAVFSPLHDYFRRSFPLIHAADSPIKLEKVNEWGLVYSWTGTNASLAPIVLMAHQDVVPVEPETIPSWTHPPFSGFIDSDLGLVWGRGAGDCKASLVSILATLESLLKAGFEPGRTVVCSFGFDEESSGTQGGEQLAAFLHDRYGDDGVAMIVDEGGQIGLEFGVPVAAPAIAEKGYLDARLTVQTPGGHSSMPRDHTSIGLLAQLITAIEADPFKPALHLAGQKAEDVNPALHFLQCTRETPNADPKLSKALRKLEKLQRKASSAAGWMKNKIEKELEKQAEKVLALMSREARFGFQTTQAVDLISGGVKINALPEQATSVINHRIDVTSSTADVRKHIYSTIKPVADKLHLEIAGDGSGWDFIVPSSNTKMTAGKVVLSDAFDSALEPAPFTPLGEAKPWVLLQGVMRAVWPQIIVAPDVMGGNTDTKSYWKLTKNIFRFSPGSDLPFPVKGGDENIHTVDERTSIHGLEKAVEFYKLLIQAVGTHTL